MFERFTDQARRALFFARFEASRLGGISIETEHLLLGLVRESKGVISRMFERCGVSGEAIRQDLENRSQFREKVPTSVEIPFSPETIRVLQFTVEEAERLQHGYIGTEHLLLGMLREESSTGARTLAKYGLHLERVRLEIVKLLREGADALEPSGPANQIDQITFLIDRIAFLVEQLLRAPAGSNEARDLGERALRDLEALKLQLRG